MKTNRMIQTRTSALLLGTVAALAACSPRTDDSASAGDSAAVAAGVGATGGAVAPAAASADSAAAGSAAGSTLADPAIAGMINTSNSAEIGTSELAAQRAKSAAVKSYAADMIKAHRALQKEGDQLTKKENITAQPPVEADDMQRVVTATIDTLKTLKGADFDAKYIGFQVQAHQQTLANLQRFQQQAKNAELKGLIEKAIPDVQSHLERAQKIQGTLTGGAAAADSTKS